MTARAVLSALLISLACAATAQAQAPGERGYTDVPEMPGGIEGRRVQTLFDAVNGNDIALARQFYEESVGPEARAELPLDAYLEVFRSIVLQTGGMDFHSVRVYDPPRPDQTVVVFRDRNYQSWQALVLSYPDGGKPDALLAGLALSPARAPSDLGPEGPLAEAAALAEMRAFVERLCERDLFSGTVLLAKGDDVLLEMHCGEASKAFHAPVDMDTKFNLGSMNKMFTATAVMQLVERGVVSLDDPISKYVDETWLPKEMTDRILVRHLLSHTSGLGSYFNETFAAGSRARWRELDDYKELVAGDTLSFEPGTDWQYSNTGMFLLGVVIESATGENYFEHIRGNIYGPAGMANTDCYDMDCPIENLAIGYSRSSECGSGWKNNLYEHVIRGGPAGGGFSTVRDLHRFARALETGLLVSPESLEQMWTVQFDQGGPSGYGFGFGVSEGAAGKVVGHGGGFTGINANLDMFLDSGYIAAVMANYDEAATPVSARIAALLARVK